MQPYRTLDIERPAPGVAVIRLNRPEAANAINTLLANELSGCLSHLGAEPALHAVVLTGAGEKAFCAGADLKERRGMDEAAWAAQHHAFERARDALLHSEKPVIAAVNGAAYGGGLELALACDFIYAAEHARFALTEATLGIMPGLGGTQTLPRAVGTRRALEMLLTGLPMSAEEAARAGLVNRICAPEQLLKETVQAAARIARSAPLSVRAIRMAVKEGIHRPLEDALALELSHYQTLIPTSDRQEGINAFNEKRRPEFSGK